MAVICFLADSDADVKRLACSVDGPFRVEIIEAPLEATALTRRAPGAVVVRADHEGAAPSTLTTLRQLEGPPVLALAHKEDMDGPGLYLWADFVLWPWNPAEVLARLQRLTHSTEDESCMAWGKLRLDEDRHEVLADGVPLDLTFTEFRLLSLLMALRGRVVTRERAYRDIWGSDHFGGLRTVDVHIRRLRSKLEMCGCPYISTVRNVGYRLRELTEAERLQVP